MGATGGDAPSILVRRVAQFVLEVAHAGLRILDDFGPGLDLDGDDRRVRLRATESIRLALDDVRARCADKRHHVILQFRRHLELVERHLEKRDRTVPIP